MLIVFCMLLVPFVQVKHQGSNQSPRLSVSIPSRSSFKVHVKVHGFQIKVHGFQSLAIQDKHQGSDLPAMAIAIQVKHQGSTRLSMVCSVIQVKHQGPYRLPMSPAIQVKHQDSDRPCMVIVFSYPGQASRFRSPRHGSSLWLSRSSFKVLISHYMVIVLNPSRSCFTDPDSVRGYRPNSKDQNSNLDYSSNIKDLISNQGYGYTLFSLSLHAFFRIGLVCLRSGYTMKNLFSFQCDRYIHLVWPLVTVGFISLLASQSKPVIMDPISVQCYSVLAVKVPLLSMPMIPNPSPIQSDRATIKDSISIQYDSVFTTHVKEQGFLLHPRLQPRPIDSGLLSSRFKPAIGFLIFIKD
ncbi:hypothetical protein F4703DRAFT_1798927 [Phycomyces blakesleeanus]